MWLCHPDESVHPESSAKVASRRHDSFRTLRSSSKVQNAMEYINDFGALTRRRDDSVYTSNFSIYVKRSLAD
jgi:hypothetical protein